MKKDVLILIPAFNESAVIYNVLKQLKEETYSYADILVINDASQDNTGIIAKSMGVKVISHVFNLRYGSALQVGYKYAVRRKYKYVIQMDADGQHDICNVEKIYKRLLEKDSPDIVLGSRFLQGSQSFAIPFAKKIAMKYFQFLIYKITKQKITDTTSGLQGLSRNAFLYYSRYNLFDYEYPDANMLLQMILLKFHVQEVPAVMHSRETGNSMHSGIFKPLFYMFIMTLSMINVVVRVKSKKQKKDWIQY